MANENRKARLLVCLYLIIMSIACWIIYYVISWIFIVIFQNQFLFYGLGAILILAGIIIFIISYLQKQKAINIEKILKYIENNWQD